MCLPTRFTLIRNSSRHLIPIFTSKRSNHFRKSEPKILITGGLGQLGVDFAKLLRKTYGAENVIVSDIIKPSRCVQDSGPFVFADILNTNQLRKIIVNHKVEWIVHFAALLSAVSEQNIFQSVKVNIEGLHNVMNLALEFNLRLFVPSSIGAFGPETPRNPTPNDTTQRPKTIYGVGKVHAELLGEYYFHKFGLDFRCLRFPGVVSSSLPGGGTTDYAITIFNEALSKGRYECYLKPDTKLPMIYIDDCLRGVMEFISIPNKILRRRTYNIAAMSFSPSDLANEIRKYVPNFDITYIPDSRQEIADAWPQVLDDSEARQDWLWYPHYNLERLTELMIGKCAEIVPQEAASKYS